MDMRIASDNHFGSQELAANFSQHALQAGPDFQIHGSTFNSIGRDLNIHQGDVNNLTTYYKVAVGPSQTAPRRQGAKVDLPWEDWELDRQFMKSLCKYFLEYPGATLDRTLNKICECLEAGNNFLGVIPNNAFPARSLLEALGYFMKLGFTLKRLKGSVQSFAKQVVFWLNHLLLAFQSNEGQYHFTWTTWKNLRKMRKLINEICNWAYARLLDQRWSQIGNGLVVATEIEEFRKCIAEAEELFRDLTVINLSGGMTAIRGAIDLLRRRDAITLAIEKIRRREGESQLGFIMDNMAAERQAEIRRAYLDETLGRRVVTNPTYDEQGKNPCDEGTRIAELAAIKQWLNSISPGSQNFLWLTGDPGSGKSAITASLARYCKDNGTLWAQFFINRNNNDTTDPNSYFPSIAWQLAKHSPQVEIAVHDRLKEKPSLMDKISPDQAAKLFVDALQVASKLNPRSAVAVIIDGLDETDRTRLNDTAEIFSHLFKALALYPNVKVFISSRTEDDIRNPFARALKDENVKCIYLDTAASIDDVSLFLRRKVARIVERYDLNWEVWPTEERMGILAARASGLFIWAVTAAKFLQEQIEEYGMECLEEVLTSLTGDALEDINALYALILRATHKRPSDWDFEKFRRIVGAIVALREPMSLDDLAEFLDLRQTPTSQRVDLANFVRRLRTVLVSGADAIDGNTVPRLHKSFFEFITNPQVFSEIMDRSHPNPDSRFRIDLDTAEADLALRCLHQFRIAYAQRYHFLPFSLRYAFQFWASHLRHSGREPSGVIIRDPKLKMGISDMQTLLSMPSRSSRCLGLAILSPSTDRSRLHLSVSGYETSWDMAFGDELFNGLQGHQKDVRCLAFSPDEAKLVSGSDDESLILWDLQSRSKVVTFIGHTGTVLAVAFSPLGDRVASGSEDFTIRLWEAETGLAIKVLQGHQGAVSCVAFSPNGTTIASGSHDCNIFLWDTRSGERIKKLGYGYGSPILSVSFIADGRQVVAGSQRGLLSLWDWHTGERLDEVDHSYLTSLAVSGNRITVGGRLGISSWTCNGSSLESDQLPHSTPSHVRDIAYLRNPKLALLYRSRAPHFNIYDLQSNRTTALPSIPPGSLSDRMVLSPSKTYVAYGDSSAIVFRDVPHANVSFMGLSPDGSIILHAFDDDTIQIWDSKSGTAPSIRKELCGHIGSLKHLAFSSDNRFIAGVTNDSIHLWEIATQTLIASGTLKEIGAAVSISFAADHQIPITKHKDGRTYIWSRMGKVSFKGPLPSSDADTDCPMFYDGGKASHDLCSGATWFPAPRGWSTLWVYLDGFIIRARESDGSVVVIPVTLDAMEEQDRHEASHPSPSSRPSSRSRTPPRLVRRISSSSILSSISAEARSPSFRAHRRRTPSPDSHPPSPIYVEHRYSFSSSSRGHN